MTREKEIQEQAKIAKREFIARHNWSGNQETGFQEGAQWADKHPNAIDFAYLQNWYQDSIDEEKEPIWTDKHLEELFNDFYLIPKDAVIKK